MVVPSASYHRAIVTNHQRAHPVITELRGVLGASPDAAAFVEALGDRLRQLMVGMVDGRVLPGPDVAALRAALLDLVGAEVLPRFAARPSQALLVLDRLRAHGLVELEGARVGLVDARAARYPAPSPGAWPELAELRAIAAQHPRVCTLAAPVHDASFAADLAAEGLPLPDELVALYAACDGFDLTCMEAVDLPVFSLLSSRSIDITEADELPRRPVVFQGGDAIQFSVVRDDVQQWWLVHEYEYEAIAKVPFDLRALLQYGLRRVHAPSFDAVYDACSWTHFFAR